METQIILNSLFGGMIAVFIITAYILKQKNAIWGILGLIGGGGETMIVINYFLKTEKTIGIIVLLILILLFLLWIAVLGMLHIMEKHNRIKKQ